MCGFVDFTNSINDDGSILEIMMNRIVHRGPDSAGKFVDENVALGFRRLSIIDLVEGDQPMFNEDGSLVLTFNGETLGQEVLTLSEAETGGLFEAPLENITFDIPEMENEQSVELTLNVTLTNGQILSAFGGSWVNNAEGFLPVVG